MKRLILRLFVALAGVALITLGGYRLLNVNAVTEGFAYLLLVLLLAGAWGFVEAAVASFAATVCFNFYFFEPIGTLTIADPRNWVALFAFLVTALVASRLADASKSKERAAVSMQQDLERLYALSRGILLIDNSEAVAKQLAGKVAQIFELNAVVLYDRRNDEFYRAGPSELEGRDEQLRNAGLQGTSFFEPSTKQSIIAMRLGAAPIGALAMQGVEMPDSVVQGIANLVAIGLERTRIQDLASQVDAARETQRLRVTMLDAISHELKTPLTSVIAATTAYLEPSGQSAENRNELVRIADEEARRLQELLDETLQMARLDTANIRLEAEPADLGDLLREVVTSMSAEIDARPIEVSFDKTVGLIPLDRKLMKLALKQVIENALKYSAPDSPISVRVLANNGGIHLIVTDHGVGIPQREQSRIFERLYRSPSVANRIPGTGLGLSIAQDIVRAHRGELTVSSRPGETSFRFTLPQSAGAKI